MLYIDAHNWLGWPRPEQAFEPEGAGARVYAEFARKKIGGALEIAFPSLSVKVGVIAADPSSDSTENPLAVVCEFARAARDEELDRAHQLAWNFSRTALLITLEPQRLIAWSCYQDPTLAATKRICELATIGNFKPTGTPQQREVRDLLHWVSLITSRVQRERPAQFPGDGRADALLLKNLSHVRLELIRLALSKEFCHDLLARVIFTQFLFHRKDSEGTPYFSDRVMRRLHDDGTLSRHHVDLASILTDKTDTYALFRWLDERFNGDLFPGKDGDDEHAREAAWLAERNAVTPEHLNLLASLVRGDLDIDGNQLTLWPYYSFDTIPLEFISSVYEEFLNEEKHRDKAYYTPSHLVDYVLDAVLPWDDKNWNLRILDPCCGSGIFLVKAFQRLIYRWRKANKREPLVTDLRSILANSFIGVDTNPEAVRVACFSLYLAMADAIEPRHYVTRENVKVFPRLRRTRLLVKDFFDEDTAGIQTNDGANNYDLVIGNAPWGDQSIVPAKTVNETDEEYKRRARANPTKAQKWAKNNDWPVANHDVGPVFLGKAAALVSDTGRVAMIETASLLYWRDGKAAALRRRLFTSFTFDEITNLSALRRDMFAGAIGPACVVVFGKKQPRPDTTLYYFTPKPLRGALKARNNAQVTQGFAVEPQDVNTLTHGEAAEDPVVWSVLALGGSRDLALVRRLTRHPSLASLEAAGLVQTRMGIIPGDQQKEVKGLRKKRYFDAKQFPTDVFLELEAESVPIAKEIYVDAGHGIRELGAFKMPQLLIKQSFSATSGRFRAALVKTKDSDWGVVCKKTYLSVRDLSADSAYINAACVVYNSPLATYFLGLTSSRMGHYITETLSKELVTVPLPTTVADISALQSFSDIDEAARRLFGLTIADWTLIEDFLQNTLPDALRETPGSSRQKTDRKGPGQIIEPELVDYANAFTLVVNGTFGRSKTVSATIYTEPDSGQLAVRMMSIHLDAPARAPLSVQSIAADGLLDLLAKFHAEQLKKRMGTTGGGFGFQRVAYFFHPSREAGIRVMNLTIVKPDERRYWTRSMAMRDADQLASAIAKASASKATTP